MTQIILSVMIVISALPAVGATSCEDLAKVALPNAAISSAQSVAAGSFTPPDSRPIEVTAAFCGGRCGAKRDHRYEVQDRCEPRERCVANPSALPLSADCLVQRKRQH